MLLAEILNQFGISRLIAVIGQETKESLTLVNDLDSLMESMS